MGSKKQAIWGELSPLTHSPKAALSPAPHVCPPVGWPCLLEFTEDQRESEAFGVGGCPLPRRPGPTPQGKASLRGQPITGEVMGGKAVSKIRQRSGSQLFDLNEECHFRAQMREKRNALLCGSLFLSLCQREIAALRALELHRITQNINMQIAFFREGNFISAQKCFFHCTHAQERCCLGASRGHPKWGVRGSAELGCRLHYLLSWGHSWTMLQCCSWLPGVLYCIGQ